MKLSCVKVAITSKKILLTFLTWKQVQNKWYDWGILGYKKTWSYIYLLFSLVISSFFNHAILGHMIFEFPVNVEYLESEAYLLISKRVLRILSKVLRESEYIIVNHTSLLIISYVEWTKLLSQSNRCTIKRCKLFCFINKVVRHPKPCQFL